MVGMSWTQREKLNTVYQTNINTENNDSNWGVAPPAQDNRQPTRLITMESHMETAVNLMFYNNAVRVGATRSGALYTYKGNIHHVLTAINNVAPAFVNFFTPSYQNAHVMIKVSHAKPHSAWHVWLRQQVREALMHNAIYRKLTAYHQCGYVPRPYFAGLDPKTGLYYVVMECPASKLTTLENAIRLGAFGMQEYRTVEAAIGRIWMSGAMLTDTSAGNMLFYGRGRVAVVDFDSSLIFPRDIRDELSQQLQQTYKGRLADACGRIRKSAEPDVLKAWDFVLRDASDIARLKSLAVQVYGRRSWLPDATMLRLLYDVALSSRGASQYGPGIAGNVNKLGSVYKPVKHFFSGLRRDASFNLPDVKVRKIAALPKDIKSHWRRRKHHHTRKRSHVPVMPVVSPAMIQAARAQAGYGVSPGVRYSNADTPNNRNMRNGPSAPIIPQHIASLVNVRHTPFVEGIASNNNVENNNNKRRRHFHVPPTEDDYLEYPELDAAHQTHILNEEMKRVEQEAYYKKFVEILRDEARGLTLLDKGIERLKFNERAKMSNLGEPNKKKYRQQYAADVAHELVKTIVAQVLDQKPLPSAYSRDTEIMDQLRKLLLKYGTWSNWIKNKKSALKLLFDRE